MTEGQFLEDERTAGSVVHNLETIGEAASRLPHDYRLATSQVPWQEVIGLRNRIVHEYFGIDLRLVWAIIRNDLPRCARCFVVAGLGGRLACL